MKRTHIIVHHTASDAASGNPQFHAVNIYHKNKDWGGGAHAPISKLGWYVQYHYFIEPDGTIIQAAGLEELRWHAGYMNDVAWGVCMAGWFDPGHDKGPTAEQVKSLQKILRELKAAGNIPLENINPHRKFAQKTCYGSELPDDFAQKLITLEEDILIVDYSGKLGLMFAGNLAGGFSFATDMPGLKTLCRLYGKTYATDAEGNVKPEVIFPTNAKS